MASVLCSRARLVSYLPGLHVLVHRVTATKNFSASGSLSADEPLVAVTSLDMGLRTVWPDESMGPFGLQDQCFPLPANVDFECHREGLTEHRMKSLGDKIAPDMLSTYTERHKLILRQFIGDLFVSESDYPPSSKNVSRPEQCFENSSVECVIQPCPELLKKDFRSMFPEAPPTGMMVVTVTQRTQNDMTSWCADVEQEREKMLNKFVDGAKEICFALQSNGFWADFIDPSSGLAYFGSYTNNTLFETDDRYSHLGFQIEDLGCCRVIRHPFWGTHIFVGTIFTDAPSNSLIMRKLQGS
uniref:Uncharacterized protein n=1 Tax=Mola mola TaxID=94237 RepID=A0A3Q3W8W4_MOLML